VTNAYLMAIIETAPGKVLGYRIFSDRHPTIAKPGTIYGLILDATGSDFGQAYRNCVKAAQGWIPTADLDGLATPSQFMGSFASPESRKGWDDWPLGAPDTET
jgi:hypothetical protein